MIALRLACLTLVGLLLLGQMDTSDASCWYRIKVRTSDRDWAGTNAHVSIKLYDKLWWENSGWIELDNPHHNDFERGRTDYFNILSHHCLTCISKIELKLRNAGKYPGWHVRDVGVRRLASYTTYQTFWCNTWLSSGTSLNRYFTSSWTRYKIRVYTKNYPSWAGTRAAVRLKFKAKNWSPLTALSGGFGRGSVRTFYQSVHNGCGVSRMWVRHNNEGPSPNWYLHKISVWNRATARNYVCSFNKWLSYPNPYRIVWCK